MSETKSILKAAICEFKKKGLSIKKTADNPFFKSKYADLATILDVIEEELANNGLVLISNLEYLDGHLVLRTVLEHKDSNESRQSVFPVVGSKPQEIGSSTTYARRYNTQALLNLAAEDDDGQAANNAPPIKDPAAPKRALYVAIMKEFEGLKDSYDLDSMWLARTDDLEIIRKYSVDGYEALIKRHADIKAKFKEMGV